MTRGERLVRSWPLKTSFYEAHDRRAYAVMVEVASRIIDDPSLIGHGSEFLARFTRDDPRQQRAYRAWTDLLAQPAEQIARELLRDDERGAQLRDSAPVFVVIPAARKKEIWAHAS
jgi:hypothetical protein